MAYQRPRGTVLPAIGKPPLTVEDDRAMVSG